MYKGNSFLDNVDNQKHRPHGLSGGRGGQTDWGSSKVCQQNFLSFLIWRKIHFGVIFGIVKSVKSTRGQKIWLCRFPFRILSMPIINRDSHHPYFVDSDHKMIPYNVSIKNNVTRKNLVELCLRFENSVPSNIFTMLVFKNQMFQMYNVLWAFIGELKGEILCREIFDRPCSFYFPFNFWRKP